MVPNKSYTTDEDTALAVSAANGLLKGSYDVDGDPMQVANNTATANGNLTVQSNGAFTYMPYPNYNGFDRFEFWVTDNQGGFTRALVNITVGESSGRQEGPRAAFSLCVCHFTNCLAAAGINAT